jgi:Transposase IS66 family
MPTEVRRCCQTDCLFGGFVDPRQDREIYRIEANFRGENADARLIVRRREAAPIMSQLKARHTKLSDEVSSKSALGKAVSYILNHWGGLTDFLDDGRVEVRALECRAFEANVRLAFTAVQIGRARDFTKRTASPESTVVPSQMHVVSR